MPIYEYGCPTCRKRRTIFFRTLAAVEADPACPECGHHGLVKLVSRVALGKSEDARMEQLADAAMTADLDEADPRSMARWARKMGGAMGDDMGVDMDDMAEEIAAGEAGPGGDDWSPG
jgi:putative FmdB family regulatory protein